MGTAWAVGGVAPVTQGIPDGRGGLLRGGPNAPLYTTAFSARPKAQEDKEKHEDRLAEALELHCVGRVLEFRESLSPTKRPPTNKSTRIQKQRVGPSGREQNGQWKIQIIVC